MTASSIKRIVLVTDFGPGIYVGQVAARLNQLVPEVPIIDLVNDLAPFRPDLGGYLVPALIRDMPPGSLYLCIVDPGVGGARGGVVLEAGGCLLVAPDNGLLSQVARRKTDARAWRIDWLPEAMSNSFHGRDWFAPFAAALLQGETVALRDIGAAELIGADWAEDLPAVVYVDRFGNLMCGLRASAYGWDAQILAAGRRLDRARTFCEVLAGGAFWYENALGLVEIAVNQGRADRILGLSAGDPIEPKVG
jgi:hypothetical protein